MANTAMDRDSVIAFVAGTLLGAGVALLFAPQSGRKTRREIRQFAEKAGIKAEAAQLELQHSIENAIGDVSEKL
jgi:gas vesicle protein